MYWRFGPRWLVADETELVREMGFSREEFIRVLPRALSAYRIHADGTDRWRVSDADGGFRVLLSIKAEPPRRIGALALPVLTVRLEFATTDDDRARRPEFLTRFERGFHKGGG